MDFHDRARHALERRDPARAMILLVQGLRRDATRQDALDFLLFIYTRHIQNPGLEQDLLKGLEFQQGRPDLLRFTVDELLRLEKRSMAQALVQNADEQGMEIAVAFEEEPPSRENIRRGPQASGEPDAEPDRRAVAKSEAVDEGETVDEPGTAAEPRPIVVEAEATTTQERRRAKRLSRSRVFGFAATISLVVILVSVAFGGWHHTRRASRLAAVDAAMNALDSLNPEIAHQVLDELSMTPNKRLDSAIADRRHFINALLRLDGRRSTTVPTIEEEEATSAWGTAALALYAAEERDWEEAMRFAHYLEHAHGDSLPAFFVRGRICEARRDWECALSRYSRIQQHFEDFLPARIGAMRIAAYRFDEPLWDKQQQELAREHPDHAYAGLIWVDPFAVDRFEESAVEDSQEPAGGADERFLYSWGHLIVAQQAIYQGNWDQARQACQKTNELSAQPLPAGHLLCALAGAGLGERRVSRDFFAAAAEADDLEPEFYRWIQNLAPRILTDMGRADWALAFTIPLDGGGSWGLDSEAESLFVANREVSRPNHFRPPDGEHRELEARAVLSRARTLLALGAVEHGRGAAQILMGFDGYEAIARAVLANSFLIDDERQGARREISRIGDSKIQTRLEAKLAYFEGRDGDAIDLVESEETPAPRLLRIGALAYLADGRGREALRLLESAPQDLAHLSLRPLRLRVLAKTGQERKSKVSEIDAVAGTWTVDQLVDLAVAAKWWREFETARMLLDRALTLAPGHPEANWVMGLLHRLEGDDRQARLHFQRGWRQDEDATYLLVELGEALLEREEFDRAREVFLRATLRDRRSIAAVAGLGKSYYLGDRRRGQRDLVEVLGKYARSDRNAAARAELYRWLAIVHGSRDGMEESWQYLTQAREIIGDRVELLLEEGRYFEARDEWEEARQAYARALQVNPTVAQPHLGLARVAEREGDRERAQGHLERAVELASNEALRIKAQERLSTIQEVSR